MKRKCRVHVSCLHFQVRGKTIFFSARGVSSEGFTVSHPVQSPVSTPETSVGVTSDDIEFRTSVYLKAKL